MPKQLYRLIQAVLMFALMLFLIIKILTNQLTWYINPRFVTLTFIGIFFLAVLTYRLYKEALLAYRQFMEGSPSRQPHAHEEDGHNHDHTPSSVNLLIMLIPLLIGILIPARPLGSATVSTKGLTVSSPVISSQSENRLFATESEQRTILGWVTLFYFEENLDPFIGEQASVVGFVYFDERLPEGQFLVSRIIVSCCAADGFAVGMVVDWPQAASLEQDSWVQVRGEVDKVNFDEQVTPLIRAESVEPVPQPDQPYLHP